MPEAKEWLAKRTKEQRRLYQQYGQTLEEEHTGEYVAIASSGETILGKRMGEVAQQALDAFGKSNFGIFRVGHRTLTRWLKTAA